MMTNKVHCCTNKFNHIHSNPYALLPDVQSHTGRTHATADAQCISAAIEICNHMCPFGQCRKRVKSNIFSNETSKLASSLLSAGSMQETYTVLPFQAQSSQSAVCLAMHGYEAISFSHNNLFGQICPLSKFEQGGYQGFVVCTAAGSHID